MSPKTPQKTAVRDVRSTSAAQRPASQMNEVDRMFAGFFPSLFGPAMVDFDPLRTGLWRMSAGEAPRVDVKEYADRYEIAAELPGLEPEDVQVEVESGLLNIRGEKHRSEDREEGEMRVSERVFGSISRSFALPEGTDPDQVAAEFVNGVLTVIAPKPPPKADAVKKIEIKAR